ncbi:MAG: hypothetical protein QOJ65_2187 [Fimbriimonadaceae bacterium]|nr:hypothetical protein [Fimbriimonadaceae bacterium]
MNIRPIFGAALALALTAGFSTRVLAQDDDEKPPEAAQPQTDTKAQDKKDDKKADQPKRDQKSLDYEKAIKDLPKTPGVFTFYQRKKDLLLEVPEDQLNKIFFIQAAMETGITSIFMQAGDPIGANEVDAYKFEKHDDQVWLIRPNFKFRWADNDMLNVAAQRSLPNAILGNLRIEQQDPEKKLLLVNATSLFYGDPFRLNDAVNFMLSGQYGLDREKSGVDAIKSFPENSVIKTHLHYYSPRGSDGGSILDLLGLGGMSQLEDDRSVPMKVTYNMWFRKDNGYVPRVADGRVGYFTQDFYNLSKFLDTDRTERYIQRFNLKKKDPTAAMSEPVKPIMWTIDSSVPEKYREAVKEGILRWNRAFEEVGYKNAVQVQDVPKDADYDHADGRYNVIRWTLSPDAGYAIALARVDPFTGEVLNASVTVDANMLAYIVNDFQNSTAAIEAAQTKGLQLLTRDSTRTQTEDSLLWSTPREQALRTVEERLGKMGWRSYECQEPQGLAASAAFAYSTLQALGTPVDREAYAKQFIADVVCHEVGHTLGLRHNFVGSTYLTTDELADDSLTSKENVTASVMDYVPVNMVAVLKGKKNFFGTTIGSYDRWAIEYGYTDFGATSPDTERSKVAKIAAKSGEPGLAYMTDENADGWNPYAVRFDNAKDPIAYSAQALEAAKRLRRYAIASLPRPGESYDKRTKLILTSISRTFREGRMSARFVGGIQGVRSYKGDAVERPTLAPVDPKLQRQAMSLIVNSCFAPDAFDLPSNVLSSMSFDPSNPEMAGWNAPLRDMISANQMLMFVTLMNAGVTDRVAENSYKWGARKDAYTMDEHFGLLMGAVFKEVGTNKSITPLRRDLQRYAVSALMQQAGAPQGRISDDAKTVASDSLKRLHLRYVAAQNLPGVDGMTKVYLRDTGDLINRFLNRQMAGVN